MKKRRSIKTENKDDFIKVVTERYQDDLEDRGDWHEARLQRYAKLRGWMEHKSYPWPNASNQHVPMLMIHSQRTQDTLHNAVLGARPIMSAIAMNAADQAKGEKIDQLQDYQLFVEQDGEGKLSDLIQSFVEDGKFVAFIPWIRDTQEIFDVSPLPPIPDGVDPESMHLEYLQRKFPESAYIESVGDGVFKARWKDEYGKLKRGRASFFVDEKERPFVECSMEKTMFDGPCIIPKDLEDVVVPARAANMQPPGPSNPTGADHVILVDYPNYDEINRHIKSGYYDVVTDDEARQLKERALGTQGGEQFSQSAANDPNDHKVQRDALAGQTFGNAETTSKVFTRLTYFGRFDLDDDGIEEEVVARILLEPKVLCRLRHLQEEFPTPTPRRPFAEASFMSVSGQFYGIGLIELLEHNYDFTKIILDQMVDKHTLANTPWGVYRSSSSLRPETIRITPGLLHPVSNPSTDISFPQMPTQDQAMAINLITMVDQWTDKQSMQGQLQFGGVPQGKSSALRTSTNMMNVLQQGDARPERILRRFFKGLSQIYKQMHELNQVYLPPNKQYRITGVPTQAAEPYQMIGDPNEISGNFQFDFKANALNTSKAAKTQVLGGLLPILANPMAMQMQLVDRDKIYNLLRDFIQSQGQDDTKYLNIPPTANQPKITAEEALGQIAQGFMPAGLPAEGAQVHLQMLQAFMQDPRFQRLLLQDPAFGQILQAYMQQVQMQVMQEQMMMQAAQQFSMEQGGGGGQGAQPGPEGQVDPQAMQMNMGQGPNQVADESLGAAKGLMP